MCRYFDQRGRVIAWYEKRRDADGRLLGGNTGNFIVVLVIDEVFEVLIEADRPVDAIRLYRDVGRRGERFVDEYKEGLGTLGSMPEAMRDNLKEYHVGKCRNGLATLRAAALADGQTEVAVQIGEALLDLLDDADSRVALVQRTLDIAPGQTAGLAAWLDEAEKLGAKVSKLRDRLAKTDPSPASAPSH
jgi:hypothetical protein